MSPPRLILVDPKPDLCRAWEYANVLNIGRTAQSMTRRT